MLRPHDESVPVVLSSPFGLRLPGERLPRRARCVAVLLALVAASCGTQHRSELDAQQLVPQVSDLPDGFNLIPAESFPIPNAKILGDPFLASSANIIRRQRISGYQIAFTSPKAARLECSAAVYRSSTAARDVYRLRKTSVASLLADVGGHPLRVVKIGQEAQTARFELGSARYVSVAWRFRNTLSTCTAGGFRTSPMAELLVVARAQQARIAQLIAR